jgi:transposase InsO family protein
VPPTATQAQLRLAFARWGRPERLRVDNGAPWGTRGDLPTDLQLWLPGMGVAISANPPRRPQDNGVVERSQGTGKRWGEPWTCENPEQLQGRFEELDEIQRREYPSIAGRSRWEAFPGLVHSGRTYTPEWEQADWSLSRVAMALAGYAVRRRADATGTISLYNRRHYIGNINKHKSVYVMFDPGTYEWVVADHEGRQLSRQPATHISREDIMNLTVSLRDKGT